VFIGEVFGRQAAVIQDESKGRFLTEVTENRRRATEEDSNALRAKRIKALSQWPSVCSP
jgi:hypothetical protein